VLYRDLEDVAGQRSDQRGGYLSSLVAELDAAHTRCEVLGGSNIGVVSRSAERGLPWRDRPAVCAQELHNVLRRWAYAVARHQGVEVDTPNTPLALACWLLCYRPVLRSHPQAAELFCQITDVVTHARAAVDRPADRVYLGPCATGDCTADLYALRSVVRVICRCGALHDTAYRKSWLLDTAMSHLGTAVEISGLLRLNGFRIAAGTIHSYVKRKHLTSRGRDERGRLLFQFAEVLQVVTERKQNRVQAS
jgi:hypothetical protein